MADITTIQTTQTKLSIKILLWRKRKCHQNTNMGYPYSQPAAYGYKKESKTRLELLQPRYYDKANLNVLHQYL